MEGPCPSKPLAVKLLEDKDCDITEPGRIIQQNKYVDSIGKQITLGNRSPVREGGCSFPSVWPHNIPW